MITFRLRWFLLLWFLPMPAAIAQGVFIRGNVSDEGNLRVPDALVTIKHKEAVHRLITNDDGGFGIQVSAGKNDSIYLSVDKLGYVDIRDSLVRINPSVTIRITLRENGFMLPDISVSASGNRIEKSDKIIYKFSSGDYMKGTQADVALRNIPGLSISGTDIRLENRKSVTVFIDGIEASFHELTTIKAEDIDKVEIISNPSASFGSELTGGVLHIIQRNPTQHAFKGELTAGKGVRLGKWTTNPLLAYQNKFITFHAAYSYQVNNQNSYIALDREDPDGVSRQTADRETKGWQDYLTARMRIAPAPKSHLLLSGYIYRYGFHTENDVRTKLPGEDDFTKYAYHSTEAWGNRQWNVLYKYEINANHYVYIKGKYLNYLNRNETEYIEKGKVRSGIKEYSAEGVYERNNLSVFAHRFDLTAGYKTVFRKYELDRAFFISQNIHSVYGDLNARLGNGLSMSASLFAEYTRNANEGVRHTYHHILPVFSILYQLPYQTNIRLSYSKKITRPAADYLNRNPIVFNPLYVLVGNPGLLPQERYSYGIGVTQNRKGGQVLSLNMLHNRYTNLISETLTNDGERIVNSYENLGNAFRSGLSMGFYTKLFGGFTLNTNGGINYHYFSSASGSVIVNENKGFSCNANINLGASLGKGFLVNLSGIYNSKDYSLAATSVMPPIFLLNVQTRLFRDKWKVEWNCFDLFATYSQTKQYIHAPGFSQTATTTNNMFNMELKMTYRFGKVFDDNFGVQGIRNDDIIMK